MIRRRTLLMGSVGAIASGIAVAAPAVSERRLSNRLELWHEYAKRTENLLARVSTERETSLLEEPIVATGSLLFLSPGTLILRDDSIDGSTTVIDATGTKILSNREGLPPGPSTPVGSEPAADWLAARLVRLFAPSEPEALIEDCRTVVPKGRGYRLDLLPPRGSAIRRVLRSVTITMDPAAGAITRIVIAEAQGDRVTLGVSDHRQNLEAQDLAAVTGPLGELGIDLPG